MVERQQVEEADPWQRLEADFARVLGEIPKPEGPELNEHPRNPWGMPIGLRRYSGSGFSDPGGAFTALCAWS